MSNTNRKWAQPRLESLEDRIVPFTNVFNALLGGTLIGETLDIHEGPPVHEIITVDALPFIKNSVLVARGPTVLDLPGITVGNVAVDVIDSTVGHLIGPSAAHHFDGSFFLESTQFINNQYDAILQGFNEENAFTDGELAFTFGELLHTVQDFYSHTNWVEYVTGNLTPLGPLVDTGTGLWTPLQPYSEVQPGIRVVEGPPPEEYTELSLDDLGYVKLQSSLASTDANGFAYGLISGGFEGVNKTPSSIAIDHAFLNKDAPTDTPKTVFHQLAVELAIQQTRHEFKRLGALVKARYGQEGLNRLFCEWVKHDQASQDHAREVLGQYAECGETATTLTDLDGVSESIKEFELLPNGKVLVAGSSGIGDPADQQFTLVQYNADGSLDQSFGTNGLVHIDFPLNHNFVPPNEGTGTFSDERTTDFLSGIEIQEDGKIVLVGISQAQALYTPPPPPPPPPGFPFPFSPAPPFTVTVPRFALARFDAQGTLDETFGNGGQVLTDLDGVSESIKEFELLPNGKVLVAGSSGIGDPADQQFTLVQYNADGSLDQSFGTNGLVHIDFPLNHNFVPPNEGTGTFSDERTTDFLSGIEIQEDGKIVLVGISQAQALYTPPPPPPPPPGFPFPFSPAPPFTVTVPRFALARFDAQGTLDETFGNGGQVLTDLDGVSESIKEFELLPNGKVLVAGSSGIGDPADQQFTLVQYNADGSLDQSFGTNGLVHIDFPLNHNFVPPNEGTGTFSDERTTDFLSGIEIQEDGKIVLVGISQAQALYTPPPPPPPPPGFPFPFSPAPPFTVTVPRFALARFDAQGTLDETFGNGGQVLTDLDGVSESIKEFELLPNGKVLVAGSSGIGDPADQQFTLVQYNADGSLDQSFGTNGLVHIDFPLNHNFVPPNEGTGTFSDERTTDFLSGIEIQEDGKIVLVGISQAQALYTPPPPPPPPPGFPFPFSPAPPFTITVPRFALHIRYTDVIDLVAKDLQWHTNSNEGGGVDITYEVMQNEEFDDYKIALYWTDSPDWETATNKKQAFEFDGEKGKGEHRLHVRADDLSAPESWTTHLVLVLDPGDEANPKGTVLESVEDNNSDLLAADIRSILSPLFTPEAIIRPVQVSVAGGYIKATFKPAGGALTLDQAAKIAGVDHFNWIQKIVAKPRLWSIEQRLQDGSHFDTLARANSTVPIQPILDPNTVPNTFISITYDATDPNSRFVPVAEDGAYDDKEYYLNDPLEALLAQRDPFTLIFNDEPRFQAGGFEIGEYVGFETQLVGVNEDGTPEIWDNTQSLFGWRTNSTGALGEVLDFAYLRVFNADNLPPIASGGVDNVSFDNQEANRAPIWNPIGDQTITLDSRLRFTISATDANPNQSVLYALEEAPLGASINPLTGTFDWKPTPAQGTGTYRVTVRATDNGSPQLSSLQSFVITVASTPVVDPDPTPMDPVSPMDPIFPVKPVLPVEDLTSDDGRPTLTIQEAPLQPDPETSHTFTVRFSEPVFSFDSGAIRVSGTAGASTVTSVGSGTEYAVTARGMTQTGSITLTIPEGIATDAFGNGNVGGTLTVGFGAFLATGADTGGSPRVTVLDTVNGKVKFDFLAYNEGFTGGVRVATGDINGDGTPDIVTGAGPGGGAHIRIFDGNDLSLINEFFAFADGFTGGVYIAVGDIDNDGFADVLAGAGAGGGPHVKVFSGGGKGTLADFFAYESTFLGGVTVAVGDIDNDGFADVITGAGSGGGPHVRVFSGAGNGTLADFFAFDGAFQGGVFVASGDVNNNGFEDLIVAAGPGGGPHVRGFDGGGAGTLADFFAFEPGFLGGVRVGTVDFDRDGADSIVTGAGPGGGPNVRVFETNPFSQIDNFFALDSVFAGGLFVS